MNKLVSIIVLACAVIVPLNYVQADEIIRAIPEIQSGGKQLRITFKARVSPGIPPAQSFVTVGGDIQDGINTYNLNADTRSVTIFDIILNSPAYYLWNSFLNMENIVSLLNKHTQPIGGDLALFSPSGNKLGTLPYFLPGNGQFDFPLSFIPGYQKPAFGVLEVNVNQDSFDGSGVQYRFDPTNSSRLEFMTGMHLRNPISGISHVFFNTMQPSRRPNQLNNEVSNWLSIANVENNSPQAFTILFYNLAGQVIRVENINIPDMGRVDIEAGHVVPGVGQLGMIEIIPLDQQFAKYLATMSRYGASSPVSSLAKLFHFATSVPSKTLTFTELVAPITAEANGETWVAVANTDTSGANFTANFYNSVGVLIGSQTRFIQSKAQVHFLANQFLAPGASGSVKIGADTELSFISEASTYYFNPERMETTAVASVMGEDPQSNLVYGSFNRFLGMATQVKISNFGMGTIAGDVEVFESSNSLGTTGFTTPENGHTLVGIEALSNPPALDTFGQIKLNTGSSFGVSGHVLRVQPSTNSLNVIDAATIFPMRKP